MNNQANDFDCLLIIDDNEAIHRDFKKIFAISESNSELSELEAELFGESSQRHVEDVKFDLRFASQGKEGYQILQELVDDNVRVGAAFVDMRMPPGWDGVETIENLWKVDPDLQVVICTAYSDRSWGDIMQKLGRTDKLLILKKPFDAIEVVQLASSLSEKRRLLDHVRRTVDQLVNVVENQEAKLKDVRRSRNAEVV